MQRSKAAMICPSCGLDNPAGATYCDDCGAVLDAAPAAAEQVLRREPVAVGTVLDGAWRIKRSQARGPFNQYEAVRHDTQEMGRLLEDAEAPPVSSTGPGPDDADVSRAARVWRALHEVDNDHLWKVEAFFYAEGRGFVAGAAVPGETLQDRLQSTPEVAPDEVKALGLSLLDGLAALHERGFLHLGLHPANVLVDAEGVAVLDGYDRLAPLDALPGVYSVMEGYSAPEAYGIGGKPGPAADVFGVGATLYYAIGHRIPTEVSREQFFYFPSLSSHGKAVPPELERVVMKALSKNPAARYASAVAMAEDLEKASLELPTPAARSAQPREERVAVAVGAEPAMAQARAGSRGTAEGMVSPLDAVAGAAAPARSKPAPPAPGFMPYRVGMRTDVGCVRSVDQDSMVVMAFTAYERSIPTQALLVIVADGMGGEAEGDKASSLAIRAMCTYVLQNHIPILTGNDTMKLRSVDPVERLQELLQESMQVANRTIYDYSLKDSSRRGMGSTLTAMMIDWPHAVFGHAGDTRAYILRHELGRQPERSEGGTSREAGGPKEVRSALPPLSEPGRQPERSEGGTSREAGGPKEVRSALPLPSDLDLVTEDHSLVGKLVRLGQLTREEARSSPQRSYLYRAMGTAAELEVDVYTRELAPGDRLMLCCDGVWEYFTDPEIVHYLRDFDDPQAGADAIILEVLRRGADDNCTAVILHVPGAPGG